MTTTIKNMAIIVLSVVLLAGIAAHSQETEYWINKRVITQSGAILKVGNSVIDDEQKTDYRTKSGVEGRALRVYLVQHTNGEWLWLQDQKGKSCGWVQAKQVILFEKALEYFTGQIREHPNFESYSCRGFIWQEKGEHDLAIADFGEAIRLDPGNASAYNNRAISWRNKKMYDKAIADFSEAIRLNPRLAVAHSNRGNVWCYKKDYDRAISDCNEALRINPNEALAYGNRGYARLKKKEYASALADFDMDVSLHPNEAWNYVVRGEARVGTKDFEKAIEDFNKAIHIDPKNSDAFGSPAWFRATCSDERYRDGKKAVKLATRACELSSWKNEEHLGTLAAAYAETGEFDQAVKWQNEALKLIEPFDFTSLDLAKERLTLYKKKRPYHEP